MGFAAPQWRPLATTLPGRLAERLPRVLGIQHQERQHDASSFVEQHFFNSSIWPQLIPGELPLLRSQGGPLSGLPFTALPVSAQSRFDSDLFRVLLLRRLRLPLPLSSCSYRCGRPLDCLGTTAQVVRGQVCWGGVGSRWSLLQRVCAEKPEHESRPTFFSVTWICWAFLRRINGAWRSSPKASLPSTVPSWRLTPPLFHFSTPTTHPTNVIRRRMVQLLRQLDAAKYDPAPRRVVPSLLSWQERLLASSQKRPNRSFGSLRERRQGLSQNRCALELASLGPMSCAAARAFASSLLDCRGHPGADGDIPCEADVLGDFCRAPSVE